MIIEWNNQGISLQCFHHSRHHAHISMRARSRARVCLCVVWVIVWIVIKLCTPPIQLGCGIPLAKHNNNMFHLIQLLNLNSFIFFVVSVVLVSLLSNMFHFMIFIHLLKCFHAPPAMLSMLSHIYLHHLIQNSKSNVHIFPRLIRNEQKPNSNINKRKKEKTVSSSRILIAAKEMGKKSNINGIKHIRSKFEMKIA